MVHSVASASDFESYSDAGSDLDSRTSFFGRFERGVKGMQKLFRWPFLICIFVIITVELCLYFMLRACLAAWESMQYLLWDKHRQDIEQLNTATSYTEWLRIATRLDRKCDHDFYHAVDRSPFYDWKTVKKFVESVDRTRSALEVNKFNAAAAEKLSTLLCRAYNANAAGLGVDNERLYAETFTGTKLLLQRYIDSIVQGTKTFMTCDESLISVERKIEFIRSCRAVFGRTALCLSSGGTMAYHHFGVVRALLNCQMIPQIICGSSGGALVAGLVGTRTDDELREFLTPALYRNLICVDESWWTLFKRYISEGKVFDELKWGPRIRSIMFDDMTFIEAFQKTGRILNITCTSGNKWGAPIILNHLTAPNVVIWCAVLASSAIPPLLCHISLQRKNTMTGKLEPFVEFGKCWSDGAIKNDIPAKLLAEQFNANYIIVSQVNPHIVPFVYECRGSSGRPVRRDGSGLRGGFLLSAGEALLKLEMRKWLRMISELDLMPMLFSQDWSSVFLQKHWGNVNVYPSRGWEAFIDILNCLSDPDEQRMSQYLSSGERAAFPKIAMISNHLILEQTLLKAEKDLVGPR